MPAPSEESEFRTTDLLFQITGLTKKHISHLNLPNQMLKFFVFWISIFVERDTWFITYNMTFSPTHQRWEKTVVLYLLIFLIPYFAATTVFQLRSNDLINTEGSPFDRMNGGLLWLTSAMALMNAVLRSEDFWRSAIWLLGSAAIGLVALDELFALHEHSISLTGDDDHPKILLLLCALAGVVVLNFVEQLHHLAFRLIIGGLAVHFVYLIVDMGDGDYFRLPLALITLHWIEEYLELTASALYFSGLFLQATMAFHFVKGGPLPGDGPT